MRYHKGLLSLMRPGTADERYCVIIEVRRINQGKRTFHLFVHVATHGFTSTQFRCHTIRTSVEIEVNLSKLISADRQGGKKVYAVEAVMELVREKIIIRHYPLRSHTLF